MSRLDRITSNPEICHGQPTVRGLRYPVENLLELLAAGMTIDEIIGDHPDLERDDLLAALEFGALASGERRVGSEVPDLVQQLLGEAGEQDSSKADASTSTGRAGPSGKLLARALSKARPTRGDDTSVIGGGSRATRPEIEALIARDVAERAAEPE